MTKKRERKKTRETEKDQKGKKVRVAERETLVVTDSFRPQKFALFEIFPFFIVERTEMNGPFYDRSRAPCQNGQS